MIKERELSYESLSQALKFMATVGQILRDVAFEEIEDTEFIIPVIKNDTSADIAEAMVKCLERRKENANIF